MSSVTVWVASFYRESDTSESEVIGSRSNLSAKSVIANFTNRIESTLRGMYFDPIIWINSDKRLGFLQREIHKLLWPDYRIVPNQQLFDKDYFYAGIWNNAFDIFKDAMYGYGELVPDNREDYFMATIWIHFDNTLVTVFWSKEWFGDMDQFYHAIEKIQGTIDKLSMISETWSGLEKINLLQKQLLTDTLTSIPNRKAMEQQVLAMKDEGIPISSLLIMDVDRFKNVNDTHGHLNGDGVLIEFASVLTKTLEEFFTLSIKDRIYGIPWYFPTYSVYRLGGDEFVILLSNCDWDATREFAKLIKESISDFEFLISRESTALDDSSIGILHVSTSIGIATNEHEYTPIEKLLWDADMDLYRDKNKWRELAHTISQIANQGIEGDILISSKREWWRRRWELWEIIKNTSSFSWDKFVERRGKKRRWRR